MADTPTVATNPDVFTKAGDTNTKKQLRNVSGEHNSEFTDELVLTDSPSVIWDTSQPGRAIAYVAEIDPDTGLPIPSTNNGKHNILSPTHPDTLPDTLVSGDVLYVDATNKLTRLPVGSDTEVLTLASGLPSWAAGGGGSGTVTSIAGGTGITNNPEPITTTGTIDLDIHSLTSTTVATGDEIPVQDVSVGNAVGDQRRTTAGAIAALGYGALLDAVHNTDTTASAVTKGDLIYGNSTPEWDDLTIGSTGQILTVESGIPAWKHPVISTPCDMTYYTCFFDDFNSQANTGGPAGTVTTNNIGPWHVQQVGTGALWNTFRGGITDGSTIPFATSCLRFSSSSTGNSGGRGFASLSGPGALGPGNTFDSNARGKTSIYFAVRTPIALSDATNHYYLNIGANTVGSETCAGAGCGGVEAMFSYSNDQNSAKWIGSTKAIGNSTCDTGVTVAADTIYKMAIVFNDDASQVDFYVETTLANLDARDPNNITGTAKCSITTSANIPGGSGSGSGSSGLQMYINLYKNAGTTNRTFYVDYFGFTQVSDTAR